VPCESVEAELTTCTVEADMCTVLRRDLGLIGM
jgi:hypothetical protein